MFTRARTSITYSTAYVFKQNNIILGIEADLGTRGVFSFLVLCKSSEPQVPHLQNRCNDAAPT